MAIPELRIPPPGAYAEPTRCRVCGADGVLLFQDPDRPTDCRRTVCGTCQGRANRRILGWPSKEQA